MSFLEWFLEPTNPGPVGKLEVNAPEPDDDEPPKKWLIWVAIGIGLILVGISLYTVFYNLGYAGFRAVFVKLCFLTIYVLISHVVTATPDYTNVGWFGGLIDNPFRISDDYNRWLIYIQVILLPGKLMAYSLIMSWSIGLYLYRRLKKQL
ncbi:MULTISPECIES: hypothetical protein [unclassified Spirosoma]|uniref:hypothetical protein n=1 Tax=unclassified Spirosoma TaxID=2621999 RepID=UPI000963DE63|nr:MULTISPECIES: hypothetical protein [unclassified Spirosoma]MBN8823467.1 hypothetical protein [Spirosoma sp.]OJW71921.1 MAG: hypothetical protein BGO59_16910 [Spirosoma sp. 48-14]